MDAHLVHALLIHAVVFAGIAAYVFYAMRRAKP